MEQILRDLIEKSINNKNEDENILIFLNKYSDKYEFVKEYLDGIENINQILDRDKKIKEIKEVKESKFEGFNIMKGVHTAVIEGIIYKIITLAIENESLAIMVFIAINMALIFDYIMKRKAIMSK